MIDVDANGQISIATRGLLGWHSPPEYDPTHDWFMAVHGYGLPAVETDLVIPLDRRGGLGADRKKRNELAEEEEIALYLLNQKKRKKREEEEILALLAIEEFLQ